MSTDSGHDLELSQRVLNLRRAGAPFDHIAKQLNLPTDVVRGLFDDALTTLDTEVQRALEVDRLDRLHVAVWSQAVAGDLGAVDRVLKISERRDKVLNDPTNNDHALRQAFDASVQTSTQVEDVDSALIEAGRKIADRVDTAVASGDGMETTKALYLLPHMVNVLRELLATPASRHAAGVVAQERKVSKLAELRSVHRTGS